eukprot:EG_transcript_17220
MASVLVGHPFDTVKVRMQQANASTKGLLAGFRQSSLMRGLLGPILAVTPQNSAMYAVYGATGRALGPEDRPMSQQPAWVSCTAGVMAGLTYGAIACPMEVVKCNMQVTHSGSMAECVRAIYGRHGLRGLFRGMPVTLLRDGPTSVVYFGVYEWLKAQIASRRKPANAPADWKPEDDLLAITLAGSVAGSACWFLSLPADLVKTRIQTASGPAPPAWRLAQQIFRQEGLRSFFRGGVACVARAFPATGCQFLGYEVTVSLVRGRHRAMSQPTSTER